MDMQLEELRVLHLPKKQGKNDVSASSGDTGVFYIDTCQRKVWIFHSKNSDIFSSLEFFPSSPSLKNSRKDFSYEVFEGKSAYCFLMRWAAGLESQVIGETDIFGQIKEAWRKAEASRNPELLELSPWIQRIFEDTKEVRTHYLQNLGGSSYGTLVRKLIRNKQASQADGPILVVGAGQIAQSITPALLESDLWIWNRDRIKLCSLYDDLTSRPHKKVHTIESLEAFEKAWKAASHVVVCIPPDREKDSERVRWFLEGGASHRSLIHLGLRNGEGTAWKQIPNLACLDDLFALQGSLGNVRSVQTAQAEKACEERAKLRALGASLSISHGWEDLACFA
jgi:glutamyl-tRNA reductase